MTLANGRGKGWRRTVTHCPAGHLYTGVRLNTRKERGGKVYTMRYCVFCDRKRKRSGKGMDHRRHRTHCEKGHPYESDNLGLQVFRCGGKEREARMCRACKRKRQREWKAAQRALERAA